MTFRPGDYAVVEASGGYVIRRALTNGGWADVATLSTEAKAIRLASALAEDHSTRALRQDGNSFRLIESPSDQTV